ncbi:hypothetical protein THRCLA_07349 [Thraustotheca clavata]|uniref:Uncharacterized protein n=1 Tax=Thraustotheca clavata TaxID=74557 RepID=A0A1V9ZEE0_9STRA|nr:hypothetical protein THRCLA_07349 [Thraustotheca clavata]
MANFLTPLEFKDIPASPSKYKQLRKTPQAWKDRVAALEQARKKPKTKVRAPRPPTLETRQQSCHFHDRDGIDAVDAGPEECSQPIDEDGVAKIPMHFLPDERTMLEQRQRRRNPLEYIKGDHIEVMWLQERNGNREGLEQYRAWRVANGVF